MVLKISLSYAILFGASLAAARAENPATPATYDSLVYTLDRYIAAVMVNNQELKLGSFKEQLSEAEEKSIHREAPVSLTASLDNSASSKQSTDKLDSVPTVTTTTNDLSAQVSKTFFTGTTIGVSYGYTYSSGNSKRLPDSLRQYHTNYVNVNLSQPLLAGLINKIKRREQQVATIDHTVSAYAYQTSVIETMVKAIEAYYNLLLKQEQLAQKEQSLEHAKMSIITEEELVNKGFSNKDKLLQYKTQILEKENELFEAQNAFQEQRGIFLTLIDKSETDNPILLITPPFEPQPLSIDERIDSLMDIAVTQRPDYRKAEESFKKAQLNYAIKRNASLPAINLTSNYYLYGTDNRYEETFSKIGTNDFNSWSVGLSVSAPLSNKSRKVQLLPSEIAITEANYQMKTMLRQIRQEIQSTYNKLSLACKQYLSASSNISAAELNLEEAQNLLDNGFTTLDEFLKSKKNQETSLQQILKNKCEYTINFYKLQKAHGTLLKYFAPVSSENNTGFKAR